MVESEGYKHVPTSRLAVFAQRLGKVFAAPATSAPIGYLKTEDLQTRPPVPTRGRYSAGFVLGSAGGCVVPVARGAGVIGFGEVLAARRTLRTRPLSRTPGRFPRT